MEHKYYDDLTSKQKAKLRNEYIEFQKGFCLYCKEPLNVAPPKIITDQFINWRLFPKGFLNAPIHLQHDHETGMTEGAVHAYCNAVMWYYEGK